MTRQPRAMLALALAALLPASARADDPARPAANRASTGAKRLVLVELFTSQG